MRRIETVFFVSVYGLAAAASLMLADAEGSPFPQILTAPLAIIAYLLTERTRSIGLPVLWANGLGLVAFLAAGQSAFSASIETRLLAGAHLMVYLTWIVLFQRKTLAQYWWLCALALLEVAVGAILTNTGSYGGMLIAFMFASIWTLAVFSLYQAQLQYGESRDESERAIKVIGGTKEAASAKQRATTAKELRSLFLRPSAARGSIQLDPDERWLGTRFTLSMAAVSAASLVVAAGFFLFIPRLWAGETEWGAGRPQRNSGVAITGFTNEVRLGDFVPLLESSKRALQVSLIDDRTRTNLDLESYCAQAGYAEPLFRGSTMETYKSGTWTGTGRGNLTNNMPADPEGRPVVRQKIVMEPVGAPILFAIHPVLFLSLTNLHETAEQHPVTMEPFRPENILNEKSLSYEVFSPRAADVPRFAGLSLNANDRIEDGFFRRYRALPTRPAKSLDRLVEQARQLTAYKPADAETPAARKLRQEPAIQILVDHLQNSGIYSYSLNSSTVDPDADPVEDFLFNRKAGHCEYFASALVLMLRAVDIPSRLVSGFKGGAVNAISGVYEVEQRHAHVWVEAYVGGGGGIRGGRWVTLDPTPAARDESVESFASRIKAAHELASVVTSTWNRFVVNIDINAQQNSFYTPIVASVRNWWYPPSGSRPLLRQLIEEVVDFARDPTQWFTAKGLAVAVALGSLVTGLVALVRTRRRFGKFLRRLWTRKRATERIRIAFYERFEKLCALLGVVRSPGQTQREFAGAVGGTIRQTSAGANGLAEFPSRLVEFFYRARFGDEDLEPAVIQDIDRELTRFEHAVRNPQQK